MSTDDSDIALLCRGRVILADLIDHAGKRKGEHPAILIDSDEQIAEIRAQIERHESDLADFYVVPVSSNNTIAPEWNLPAPARAGLKGFTQCAFASFIPLGAIKEVTRQVVREPEIDEIEDKVQEYNLSKLKKKHK
jgi:hypothetical protein